MSNKNLIRLQHFFSADKMIKKQLYDICPPFVGDAQNLDSIIKYTDDTYIILKYVFNELNCICTDFIENQNALKEIDNFGKNIISNFIKCGADIEQLRNFYKNFISNMKPEFVNSVKNACIGYTDNTFPDNLLNQVSTINEMLHIIHSYIMNNEKFYQSVDKVAEKKNKFNYPINLYGEQNDFSTYLFSQFPIEIDCGYTDIVSVENERVIMMIRDRGHALTIEISKEKSRYRIEYFIPKICNIDMVNALPGVNKVESNHLGTTGVFETENIMELYNLIANVPTDLDKALEEKKLSL